MADHGGFDVGVLYSGALDEVLARRDDLVDTVSLIPETLWHEAADAPRYTWIDDTLAAFERVAGRRPVVLHGIGLSIASGLPLDEAHVDQVTGAIDRFGARWYSEHLAAFRVGDGRGGSAHAGLGLPVPMDDATLRALVPKVARAVARVEVPMLLENNAVYVDVPGNTMTEAGFLNRLCDETGAGVLLDLHNLHVSERNRSWDTEAYLAELDLRHVVEVHVAGGEMMGAFYTDAHSGACPEPVWDLLQDVAAAAPRLRLVTFEIHESRVAPLGLDGLEEQFGRIRAVRDEVAAGVA